MDVPFRVSSSPMIAGGVSVREKVQASQPSIFRDPAAQGTARVRLPAEAPKYPESKHTMTCVARARGAAATAT